MSWLYIFLVVDTIYIHLLMPTTLQLKKTQAYKGAAAEEEGRVVNSQYDNPGRLHTIYDDRDSHRI